MKNRGGSAPAERRHAPRAAPYALDCMLPEPMQSWQEVASASSSAVVKDELLWAAAGSAPGTVWAARHRGKRKLVGVTSRDGAAADLPPAPWRYGSWMEFWFESTASPGWMLRASEAADRKSLTSAACEAVRRVVRLMVDPRSVRAVELAEAWSAGAAVHGDMVEPLREAVRACGGPAARRTASREAASAASSCLACASLDDPHTSAAHAFHYALSAELADTRRSDDEEAYWAVARRQAEIVRRHIPVGLLLLARIG